MKPVRFPFRGLRVFLSRNYVPEEQYPALQDALTHNGAEVFPCLNPSENSDTDFHVLACNQKVKIEELLTKGCKVVGPECVIRCAKEHKPFPNRNYTCCLSMDGVVVLSTGFKGAEKSELEQLVNSMSGTLQQQRSPEVDFVIAKSVLAGKYKWAWSVAHKPILTHRWLRKCASEHRLVPHTPYRLPPFTGICICVTGITLEERDRIQDISKLNGATYSARLESGCTHLIADLPEGPKYALAKGLKVVSQQWFWQSVDAKLCLDEDNFPVCAKGISIANTSAATKMSKQEIVYLEDQAPPASPASGDGVATSLVEEPEASVDTGPEGPKCETQQAMYLSGCRIYLTGFEAAEMRNLVNIVRDGGGTRHMELNETVTHVILGPALENASAQEMKNIRQLATWGAVYVLQSTWLVDCSHKRREVAVSTRHRVHQNLLAQGRDQMVSDLQEKKVETVSVPAKQHTTLCEDGYRSMQRQDHSLQSGVVMELLHRIPTNARLLDSSNEKIGLKSERPSHNSENAVVTDQWVSLKKRLDPNAGVNSRLGKTNPPSASQTKGSLKALSSTDNESAAKNSMPQAAQGDACPSSCHEALVSSGAGQSKMSQNGDMSTKEVVQCLSTAPGSDFGSTKLSEGAKAPVLHARNVFKGHVFGFSGTFPSDKRAAIMQLILGGGGSMEDDGMKLDFFIGSHGTSPVATSDSNIKHISSHWITQCLEEGRMIDVHSHVLFQPLPCQIPLSGFQGLKLCVSQYDRRLLGELCHVLEVELTENINSSVSHLLCKTQAGDKYAYALCRGIQPVTVEWLYACIAQNKVVPVDDYRPQGLSAVEQAARRSTRHAASLAPRVPSDSQIQCPTQNQFCTLQSQAGNSQGKKSSTRKKAVSSRGTLSGGSRFAQPNTQSASCLSSQTVGSTLDAWDANSPWVADVKASQESTTQLRSTLPRPLTRSMKNTISQKKVNDPSGKPGKCSPSSAPREDPKDETSYHSLSQKAVDPRPGKPDIRPGVEVCVASRQGERSGEKSTQDHCRMNKGEAKAQTSTIACTNNRLQKDSQTGGTCPPNVVDAIEGLLRQTSKAKGDSSLEIMKVDQDHISPEPTTLNRRSREDTHSHTEFKKPKLYPTRSSKLEGEPKSPSTSTPNQDVYLRFDESQIDSQMVAYDEDHSERQRIMEKVRTRSSTIALSSMGVSQSSGEKSGVTWKGDQKLGRLFKAAEANK